MTPALGSTILEGHQEKPFIRAQTRSPSRREDEDAGRGEGEGDDAVEGVREGMAVEGGGVKGEYS